MDSGIKILSWNINGLRTQKNNFKQFLDNLNADIICFQETKITRDQLEEVLAIVDGYVSFFSFSRKRSGYSGVATFCKKDITPSFAQEGLSGTLNIGSLMNNEGLPETLSDDWDLKDLKDLDSEGRCIITQHFFRNEDGEKKLLTVINVYCPRVDPEKPERALYKLSFYKLLRQRASVIRRSSSVIIVGDLNTSHKKLDHCDPCDDEEFEAREDRIFLDDFLLKSTKEDKINKNTENIFPISDEEKDPVSSIDSSSCDSFKMVDTFRYFYPFKEKCFTCWNMRINARSTNYGTRIDYVLSDEEFLSYIGDAFIHADIEGSDHCPVSVDVLRLNFLGNHSIPPICTKFYPEFHGSQQNLLSYFKPNTGVNFVNNLETASKSKYPPTHKRKSGESSLKSINKKRGEVRQSSMKSFLIKSYEPSCIESESSSSYQNTDSESNSNSQHLDTDSETGLHSWAENTFITNEEEEQDCKSQGISDTKKDFSKTNMNSGWGFLMQTPAPPPLCPGHKEPCALRTVKKKGPNFNKQFYACARGVGKEGDPQSQCNFFKWLNGR